MPPFFVFAFKVLEILPQWYDTWTVPEVAQRGIQGGLVVLL